VAGEIKPTALTHPPRASCIFGPHVPRDCSQLRHYTWANLLLFLDTFPSEVFAGWAELDSEAGMAKKNCIEEVESREGGMFLVDL
jgi:hypothetical protein